MNLEKQALGQRKLIVTDNENYRISLKLQSEDVVATVISNN